MPLDDLPTLTWVPGMDIGAFRLLREIARGGMGEIWLAHQRGVANFERLVVIKRIIANSEDDSGFVDLFLDEARIVAQLHHPNIVQVFDLGQLNNSYYLVMEFLSGQPLARVTRRVLQSSAEFPAAIGVEIISAAARGLGYAHRRKDLQGEEMRIVHRDVSPQNIFITYDGQVKVLDFGIAKAAGRLTRTSTGVVRGKAKYMSPEQAVGNSIEAMTDVYALGIMLFEIVTGTRLYGDIDEGAVLSRLVTTPAPRASERKVDVDRKLDAIIGRMLDHQPGKRFPDGQAVHEALEEWLRQQQGPRAASIEATMRGAFSKEIAAAADLKSAPLAAAISASAPAPAPAPASASGSRSMSMPDFSAGKAAGTPAPRRLGLVVAGGVALLLTNAAAWLWLRPGSDPRPPAPVSAPDPQRPPAVALVQQPPPALAPTTPTAQAPTPPPVAGAAVVTPQPTGDAGPPTPQPVSAPAAPKVSVGRLTLDTDPWTRVSLGKKALGETPLVEVSLPAGHHRLRLVNEEFRVDTVIEVDIRPNALTSKKLSF